MDKKKKNKFQFYGKKKNKRMQKTMRSKAFQIISKALDKKHSLKKKKHGKKYRSICPHHYLSKSGKAKTNLFVSTKVDQETGKSIPVINCKICGETIPANIPNSDEIKSIMKKSYMLISQGKYYGFEIGVEPEVIDRFAKCGTYLIAARKDLKGIGRVVAKTQFLATRNKDKPKKDSSKFFGTWGDGRR